MKPAFSLNHYIWPDGRDLIAFLDLAVRLNASMVALTRRAIEEMPPARLATELRARGLTVSTLNSAGFFTGHDEAGAKANEEDNLRLLDAAAMLSAHTLCVITGGTATAATLTEARADVAAGLARLDEEAAARGLRLGLEPIHPADILTKGCVSTIAQAAELAGSLRATGLVLDLFHSWWDPDLAAVLEGKISGLTVLQVCAPVERNGARHRDVPEAGWASDIVARLVRHRPETPIEIEIFAANLFGRDPEEVLRTSLDRLRESVTAC